MNKNTLALGVAIVAFPAFAAQAQTAASNPPTNLPATTATSPTPSTAAPADSTAPAEDSVTSAATPAPADSATASTPAPAPGEPAARTPQVAQVVQKDFATFDKDANSQLSNAEFGSWMVALRKASEPGVTAEAPAMKTWLKQAFAQADKDKSGAVSQPELVTFLTPAA